MSDIRGTKQAFKKLIRKRGIYKQLGVDRTTASKWKRRIELERRYPSEDTMRKLLQSAGARVIQEVVWKFPE